MAAYEVLLLNTAIPQIQAAQSGDTYVVPRDIAFSAALTLSAGTANGVPYLNGSKVVTTGTALTFDGTSLGIGQALPLSKLHVQGSGTFSTDYDRGAPTGAVLVKNGAYGSTSTTGAIILSGGAGNNNTHSGWYVGSRNTSGVGGPAPYLTFGAALTDTGTSFTLGTEYMRLDSSGNLGLVAPSAWNSGYKAFQVNSRTALWASSAGDSYFSVNYLYDGADKYIANGFATAYQQVNGQHIWKTAASGTAGNAITFTQAMTLDASGRLLVKATSNTGARTKLAVGSGLIAGNAVAYISTEDIDVDGIAISNWTGSATTNRVSLAFDSSGVGGFRIGMPAGVNAFQIYDSAAATERARITSGGYFKASNAGTYVSSTGVYHEFRQTANDHSVQISATNASLTTGAVLLVRADRNTTSNTFYAISYYNDGAGAMKFRVADSGDVTNTNGSYGTISDAKMKTDIVDVGSQWADIKALRFRKFKMKDDPSQRVQLGVVAQEVEQTSPGLVDEHIDKDAEGNDLGTTTKSVKTSVLLMKAAVALQEAMARIEQLEAKVASLGA